MNVPIRPFWQPYRPSRASIVGASLLLLVSAFVSISPAGARDTPSLETITTSALPEQGREVLKLIRAGGPFQHAKKDGSTFGNVEQRLPKQPRGYYKEYTVPTPGAKNRGARRIVCGGEVRSANSSTCYYTADHYNSFKRILE